MERLLKGMTPLYILARKIDRSDCSEGNYYHPLEVTVKPDSTKQILDYHYLEFRMEGDIPIMTRLNLKDPSYYGFPNALEMQLSTIKIMYHVYATVEINSNNKINTRTELLYYGPNMEIANKVLKYYTKKYQMEDAVDFILSKYSGQRDFKLCNIELSIVNKI